MNEISVFNNTYFGTLGVLYTDGKALFPATECAKMLGYRDPDSATRRHCRYPAKQRVPHPQSKTKTVEMVFIPEGDLYRLITHSKLQKAQEFESWVFDEVLPTIRTHGGYLTPAMAEQVLTDPDTIIRLATELKQERALRVGLEHQARINAPLVAFANNVTESENDISVGDMAKLICQSGARIGRNRLYIALRRDGYCMKNTPAGRNIPTQYAIEHGWMRLCEYVQHVDGKVLVKRSARVTGKGQLYFMELYGKK